jgi:hypothetical protein
VTQRNSASTTSTRVVSPTGYRIFGWCRERRLNMLVENINNSSSIDRATLALRLQPD